ncbi:proline-serine-threonine phosphatase-interacting protein 2 [Protopterus annectens]|uniref:proline-serine-threonine phosphatase-interacting protein 2 n=1 Tax=Protopterus annectens TaxID=7888 RepID=UPI001CFB73C2|nr:proline-serine-threonine phosphatase-interacting protein 2 [Protopterus annectens]
MREAHFKDFFWNSDITSTAGYDNILQRLNDGRKTCKEIEDFMKARASIEEKYGKDLLNLSKKSFGQAELNTTKKALEVFKQKVENVGQAHLQLAQSIKDEAKRLEDFREKQKESRKKIEHTMEQLHKLKTSQYKKTMDSKKTYEQKCRDKDEAEQALNRNANTGNLKQQEKLTAKSSQAKSLAEEADRNYQQNVSLLEKIRENWLMEHTKACEFFEIQECERVQYTRNTLWTHVNLLSQQCVTSDEMYEEVRKSLEGCSISKDIEYFIDLRKTGDTPPAQVPYENFYSLQRNPGSGRSQVSGGIRREAPLPPATQNDAAYSMLDGNYSLAQY